MAERVAESGLPNVPAWGFVPQQNVLFPLQIVEKYPPTAFVLAEELSTYPETPLI
jgi:hypothetical protein